MPELVALNKDITLHHLLSHTSGLQDIYDVPHLPFEIRKLKIEQGEPLLSGETATDIPSWKRI